MKPMKHTPKFKRERKSIHRRHCPYCDGSGILYETIPDTRVNMEGHDLPFRITLRLFSDRLGLDIRTPDWPFKFYKREYQVGNPERLTPDSLLKFEEIDIKPTVQRFTTPIKYCPMCGRDFAGTREKNWRRFK